MCLWRTRTVLSMCPAVRTVPNFRQERVGGLRVGVGIGVVVAGVDVDGGGGGGDDRIVGCGDCVEVVRARQAV